MVDFERIAINAFQNRSIEAQGCFYHHFANNGKHIQHLRLPQRYKQEEEYAIHIRMLPALAFLPFGDVIEGFEELVNTIRVLYDDVADNFLGTTTSVDIEGMHQDALHFLLSINETCRTDDELSRTSSSVEGWHQNFQGHISAYHLCFGNFYRPFKKKKILFVFRLSSTLRDIQHHHQGNIIWIQAAKF